MNDDVFQQRRLEELRSRVEAALRRAGLMIFPAGEEGSDPGGAVVNVERGQVCVGWFTSDAFMQNPQADESELHRAIENTMVRAMADILTTMGIVARLQPWQFDDDVPGLSVAIVPSDQRNLGA